jgi:hypothetical protein
VENFFSALTRRRIRRGAFKSIADLQAAINRYLDEHNANPNPLFGPSPPMLSSPKSSASLYPLYESVHSKRPKSRQSKRDFFLGGPQKLHLAAIVAVI